MCDKTCCPDKCWPWSGAAEIGRNNPKPKVNPLNLSTEWKAVDVPYKSTIICLADPGVDFVAVPFEGHAQADNGVAYTSQGAGAERYIHLNSPGKWNIKLLAGGANVQAIQIDTHDDISALIYGAKIRGPIPLVPVAPTFATVGAVSALALAANPHRRFLSLTNTDATKTISVGFGSHAAVSLSGVVIPPLQFRSWNESGEDCFRDAVNLISTGAAHNVAIQEAN